MSVHSTDRDWEVFAQENPYWAVITNDKYRTSVLDSESLQDFFSSGESYIASVFKTISCRLGVAIDPERALDFGCGVGRLVIPLACRCREVVGVDVSETMLDKARQHVAELGIANVAFEKSDDGLSRLTGSFDLIHSYIVFQHIPVERGLRIFERLLQMLGRGGVGVLQFTYGAPPKPPRSRTRILASSVKGALLGVLPKKESAGPVMQMNHYPLPFILDSLRNAGVWRLHCELSDHGGEYGTTLFFQKPQ